MKKPAALPDTNFILRYLLRDIEEQFAEADAFFENVRVGRATALVAESVLVECLYILTKYYRVSRADIAVSLTNLLLYKGIQNKDKEVLTQSLALFAETSLDPVDCILAARAAVAGNSVLTFDKALNKVCTRLPDR
ncbi:MAG: hypothetical protein A2075_13270 [Geobacteraceae bacterium GWC2_58_44]|nr:MAG: hypothetical protein A2075_13270 [Geobacteraceae bacterium GWC2_58_44]HBG04472.1 hypothetical protein [Geobacter sp.]